jgi:hypothetical protein
MEEGDMPFPEFPASRKIDKEDKPVFDEAFAKMQPQISEFTFTNLFLWGQSKNYKVSMIEGHILVFYEEGGKTVFFSPIGPEPAKIINLILGKEKEAIFSRVPESVARGITDTALEVVEDRGNFDYVYNRTDLAELKGAKYYPKRSFAERAMKYDPVIIDDRSIDIEKCKMLQKSWCNLRGCDKNRGLNEESAAIYNMFKNKHDLGVMCVGIEVEGQLVAFAAVEQLNKETCVVHFEKADMNYTGMYQLINREFAKRVPENYKYINREQDLGVEGLRKAKLSYYPAFLVKKFMISRKT